MANENSIELLMSYGFDRKSAEDTAKLADDFQDKALRKAMTKEQRAAAETAVGLLAQAKEFYDKRAEADIASVKKAEDEKEKIRKQSLDKAIADEYAAEQKQTNQYKAEIEKRQKIHDDIAGRAGAEGNLRGDFISGQDNDAKEAKKKIIAEKEYLNAIAQAARDARQRDAKNQEAITQKHKEEAEKRAREEARVAKQIIQENKRAARESQMAYRQQLEAYVQGAERIKHVSRGIALASSAALAGAYALAQKYIVSTDDNTQLTERWKEATDNLTESQMRIGKVVASQLLPVIEKAAEIAEKLADFAEENPELIKRGLEGLGAISAIATVVSTIAGTAQVLLQGVKILEKITGSSVFAGLAKGAASKGGGMLFAPAGGEIAAGGAGLAGAAPAIGVAIAGVVAVELERRLLNAAMGTDKSWGDIGETAKQAAQLPTKLLILGLREAGAISEDTAKRLNDVGNELWNLGKKAEDTGENLDAAADGLGRLAGSDVEKQIVDAYTDMIEADLEQTKQYAEARAQIIKNGQEQEKEIARQTAEAIKNIVKNYNEAVKDITASYTEASIDAEEQYQEARRDAAEDAARDIERIQENLQIQLEQMEEQHNANVKELTAARDAVGLVKENERYQKERDQAIENAEREIAERKEALERQLNDLKEAHAKEEAERKEAYEKALEEAKKQELEQIAEAKRRAAEELARSREQNAKQLEDLKKHNDEEFRRRHDAFIKMVRDLDASLIGEQDLKKQYYQKMLADAQAFLDAYQATMPSSPTQTTTTTANSANGINTKLRNIPARSNDDGYALAMNGSPKFVMNGSATRMAERLIGGQLTQARVLAAISGSGGKSLTVNDNRRFDGMIPPSVRREIADEAINGFAEVLNGN